jgi:hypothetical protein
MNSRLENKIHERIDELKLELKQCKKAVWPEDAGEYKVEDINEKILELKYILGQAPKPRKTKIPKQAA